MKRKAMTSEQASAVKKKGHEDAREFANLLGIKEFKSDPTAKKDVIDNEGFSYSVKSGEKKWQIFLYSKTRFERDYGFQGINGLAKLFIKCIEAFPTKRTYYLANKALYKEKLKQHMIKLCNKLKIKRILAAFLDKSLFNSGEVDFFVIKEKDNYYIFYNKDVVETLAKHFEVENSKARGRGQMDSQKVVFKVKGKTYGEIEMRNDSDIHYREVKFWLDKNKTTILLKSNIKPENRIANRVVAFGRSIKKLKHIKI